MSISSFHQHFKSVTSMRPLQYQKALRLQEARRLMLTTMTGAATASRQVGYLSASQFSRDYSHFFGSAPTRDISRLREHGFTAADVTWSTDERRQQQHGPEMNNGRRRKRATQRLAWGALLVGNESHDDELQPDQRASRRSDDDVEVIPFSECFHIQNEPSVYSAFNPG